MVSPINRPLTFFCNHHPTTTVTIRVINETTERATPQRGILHEITLTANPIIVLEH